ncbi:hypothetical protein D7Z94_12680 [Ulvibacterium marinum]|uniref:Uncharacterized protein n=1 Tax=Ulvibacterium marinum TaxID=2419782 RepID=A0A3B0C724_9FLAO|nr:hypothetical protein D7Z94_12680 [Ulvibacterium marinum]
MKLKKMFAIFQFQFLYPSLSFHRGRFILLNICGLNYLINNSFEMINISQIHFLFVLICGKHIL